jgi:hypothetical protein
LRNGNVIHPLLRGFKGEKEQSALHILCRIKNDPPHKSSPGCPWVHVRPEKRSLIATIVYASLNDLPTTCKVACWRRSELDQVAMGLTAMDSEDQISMTNERGSATGLLTRA